jgi:hypothetical protein
MDAEFGLRALARLVLHLERSQSSVTDDQVRIAASRWGLPSVEWELDALLTTAVDQIVLFTDLRTSYVSTTGTFSPVRMYRVNPRHPIVVDAMADED